jgi:hypothetical protein
MKFSVNKFGKTMLNDEMLSSIEANVSLATAGGQTTTNSKNCSSSTNEVCRNTGDCTNANNTLVCTGTKVLPQ